MDFLPKRRLPVNQQPGGQTDPNHIGTKTRRSTQGSESSLTVCQGKQKKTLNEPFESVTTLRKKRLLFFDGTPMNGDSLS